MCVVNRKKKIMRELLVHTEYKTHRWEAGTEAQGTEQDPAAGLDPDPVLVVLLVVLFFLELQISSQFFLLLTINTDLALTKDYV